MVEFVSYVVLVAFAIIGIIALSFIINIIYQLSKRGY